jgi:RimJ/RimL family protein N-acetyltransferase
MIARDPLDAAANARGVIAETKRLLLREFRPEDAAAMRRVFGDPDVMRFGKGVQTAQWVGDWIRRQRENYRAPGGIGLWAVVEKTSEETIGYCGLTRYPDICGRSEIEVGYRLARPYWGRGYATEAARAVCAHAYGALNLPRLIALIDPGNLASIRVAEKLGMRHENDVVLEGYTHADRVYAVERENFR